MLARHPRLKVAMEGLSLAGEEVLASLLGALILKPGPDRDALVAKATMDALSGGAAPANVVRLIQDLWDQLGAAL